MEWLNLILIAVSLAMDAFAVSVCDGLQYPNLKKWHKVLIALTFGFFQGFMPVVGYYLGELFINYIQAYDHWVAFGLLLAIGGFMIFEGIKGIIHPEQVKEKKLNVGTVILQGIATSIDALIVGITLAMMGINIFVDAAVIMGITFVISLIGIFLGVQINKLLKGKTSISSIIGGSILIILGTVILIEHLLG